MYTLFSIVNLVLYACDSPNKSTLDSAVIEDVPLSCPNGVYPALFQVWNSEEEQNLVDTPPFCEAPFEIELLDGDILYSAGDCEVQAGQQTRSMSYVFQGELDETGNYAGEVSLTKPNGNQDLASFSGACTQTESTVQINIYWNMTVTTPNGEREYVGVLQTEE